MRRERQEVRGLQNPWSVVTFGARTTVMGGNLVSPQNSAPHPLFATQPAVTEHTLVSEGLLVYLDAGSVISLGRDLHAQPRFKDWLIDPGTPKILGYIKRKCGRHLDAAPMLFAPPDWRMFFADCGWQVMEFHEMARAAHKVNREPRIMQVYRGIERVPPDWVGKQRKIWESGVALLRRT